MNVFWRCVNLPFTTCSSRRYQRLPLLRFCDAADCLTWARAVRGIGYCSDDSDVLMTSDQVSDALVRVHR